MEIKVITKQGKVKKANLRHYEFVSEVNFDEVSAIEINGEKMMLKEIEWKDGIRFRATEDGRVWITELNPRKIAIFLY